MTKIILVTGASSGFGRLTAEALAKAGHIVYASMRDTAGRNAAEVAKIAIFSKKIGIDLRTVELDVQSRESVDAAIAKIMADTGRIDVVMHNAGHMAFGPAEAFTPEQFAQLYDVNVLSAQRVNRTVLPHLRRQRRGLLVWVSSSSSAGGTPPIWPHISPRRPAWTPWRCNMPGSFRAGVSRRQSLFPVPSPAAPITSRIPANPPTRRA